MRLSVLVLFFALAGCASQIMESYIGKPITEPILDYGPPINVLDLDANTRAYQWKVDASGAVPIYAPNATVATWIPYSNTCVYTLLAQPSGKNWVVTGYRKPTFDCE